MKSAVFKKMFLFPAFLPDLSKNRCDILSVIGLRKFLDITLNPSDSNLTPHLDNNLIQYLKFLHELAQEFF